MLSGSIALLGVVATVVIFYVMASPTFGWTGARPLREPSAGRWCKLLTHECLRPMPVLAVV